MAIIICYFIFKISYYCHTRRDVFHCRPDDVCSHTAVLTTMMYFNQTFNIVTLVSSHSTLTDDGDHTETFCSYCYFNVNFNTPLKTILLCISWQ